MLSGIMYRRIFAVVALLSPASAKAEAAEEVRRDTTFESSMTVALKIGTHIGAPLSYTT